MAVSQAHYRFGVDELAESTHGWYAAQNTNPNFGVIPFDTTFLLRFLCQCDATALSNADFEFQYRKNGGTWTQISTSSLNVRAVTPTCWADAAHTTNRLTGGTGTFEASSQGCTADGISGGTAFDIVSNGFGETECAMQLRSADLVPGDFIEFRLTRDGALLMDTYAVTPALGIPLTPAVAPSESTRVFDRLTGAARGVATAMIAVGMFGDTAKLADHIYAQMNPPPFLQVQATEQVRTREWVFGASRQAPTDRSVGLMEGDVFHLQDQFGHLFQTLTEPAKVDDGGRVELIGLGNPIRITDGPIIAQIIEAGNISVAVADEIIKISDGPVLRTLNPEETSFIESLKVVDSVLGPTLDPEQAVPSEALKVVDQVLGPTLDPEETTLTESLKVVDTLGVLLDPEEAAPTETPKLDDGGFVELIGLGNPIKVSDSVSAQLVDVNPTASLSESLKVNDTLFITINPEETNPSEALKIVDQVLGPTLDPEQATPGESLKVLDTVSIFINPEQATPGESLKIVDGPITASLTNNDLDAPLTESFKVVDTVSVTLNPEESTPSETTKVDDGGFVELRGLGNPIRVVDGPVIAALVGNELTVSQSESIRVIDQLSVVGSGSVNISESIRVSEILLAALVLNVSVSESLKVSEGGFAELSRDETIKISDSLLVALGNALVVSLSESLKVVDTVFGPTINPEQAAPSESLKITDSVSVQRVDINTLQATAAESIKVADTVAITINPEEASFLETVRVADSAPGTLLNPLQATPNESLKVADAISVQRVNVETLLATVSESIKVADTVAITINPEEASFSEVVRVADGAPATLLNPLQATPSESLKVVDEGPSITTGTTIAVIASESAKVIEQLTVALDPEETSASESARVVDTAAITINPEETDASETVRCQDIIIASLGTLQVDISEHVKCRDQGPILGGPRVIDVIGGYSGQTVDVVGGYAIQTLDVVGGYGEG